MGWVFLFSCRNTIYTASLKVNDEKSASNILQVGIYERYGVIGSMFKLYLSMKGKSYMPCNFKIIQYKRIREKFLIRFFR